MAATRYKIQLFEGYFRMYDSQIEQPSEGEIARYEVNLEEAEMIKEGASVEVNDAGTDVIVFFEEGES